ncbi:hypothetical protein H4N54_24420 [Limnospira fusiformis KN01]|uniref:hypothetical protein n=1 Tax=Limnospira TaxID=2596745 RepID=UPI001658AB94|nr:MULTISPECIES: hypothetical protein [Limnospira]MDT9201352.1 hypothetical protein [Limnospira sp. PMC 1042.18]ULB45496.1 hypothetical protein H4N54_24420 [Limnospira fusiformis KN01]
MRRNCDHSSSIPCTVSEISPANCDSNRQEIGLVYSRLAGAIALQHTRTLVGWVERSLYTTDSDSSRLAGAIALHNRLGL